MTHRESVILCIIAVICLITALVAAKTGLMTLAVVATTSCVWAVAFLIIGNSDKS